MRGEGKRVCMCVRLCDGGLALRNAGDEEMNAWIIRDPWIKGDLISLYVIAILTMDIG